MNTGIYKIENIKNGRIYIGSASGKGFKNRWGLHKSMLKKNIHHSLKMQRAYNKYKNCFIYSIIEFCCPTECIKREQYYIDKLKPFYNTAKIAGSNLGIKRSSETILKLSQIKKGKPPWNKGKKMHESTKLKLSKLQKGKKQPLSVILAASKIVLDLNTGVFYNSCKEAAYYNSYNHITLSQRLRGYMKNKTSLIYA